MAFPLLPKESVTSARSGNLWNSDRLQNEWSDTAVTRILRDERYTGKLIGIKTTRTELGNQNSSRKQSKEDWIVVPGAFEAIISQETFDEAQRQLERLRRRSGKRETNAPAVHLFSRKLKCGHCGLALGRHVVELGVYYRCEGRAWNSGAACLGARLFEDDLIRTVLASIRFPGEACGKKWKNGWIKWRTPSAGNGKRSGNSGGVFR
ncbi:MAG: recombinase family protein [Flavonifractor plautii]